ncbi:hypothetical protein NQ315_004332, partial [Exocentrus adspersus]
VEKQLQGNEAPVPMGTPHMSYKKSHSGSTGNIHGLVGVSEQGSADNLNTGSTKLLTFTGGCKSSIVQMRRTTNKRGKTAPAPPKRTSLLSSCSSFRDSTCDDQGQGDNVCEDGTDLNGIIIKRFKGLTREMQNLTTSTKCDSESDLQDQTPDTDDSGAHSYPEVSTVSNLGPGTGSFKRAPIMGNRGLEQRGKKTKTKDSPVVQVAALEVQNVRKAISRYGTLPKGARIGAYLESLRQSGMSTNEDAAQAVNPVIEQTETTPRSLSPRTNIRTQPQMIRSNSSSGVTSFNAGHPPSSPTSNKLSRNRHMVRANTGDVRSSLRTFKASQNSTFRGGSPSRAVQPTLADLEFPPPPTDLPPPPEEYDIPGVDQNAESGDISTLQPSVEEASSRFGVSLKKREPSTDSCNSFKENKEEVKEKSPQRTSLTLTSPSQDDKSPMSVDSDVPMVGSPLEPLPPPPIFPENNEDDIDNSDSLDDNKTSKVFKNKMVMKEMELKLVAEIKERADQKGRNVKESPLEPLLAVSGISHDPVAQLVTELSQSLNIEKDLDRNVRKNSQGNVSATTKPVDSNGVTLVTQLKKVDSKKPVNKEKLEGDSSIIIDFKSRLRKVESEKKSDDGLNKNEDNEIEGNKRESTASSDSGNLKIDEADDKRKSTGSISSLKKLWEAKDAGDSCNVQLSPKLCLKNNKSDEVTETSPVETSDESVKLERSYKSEKKCWPPGGEEKPVVPTKPPVKAVKPIMSRPTGSTIYATPNSNTSKPPIMAKPSIEAKATEEDAKLSTSDKSGKENILEISQALESTLNSIKTNPAVSTATWLQLSDKIGLLHGSCMDYADNVVPAHTKFHFRELLTRLECQARQLRSAGSRNTSENARCINEVNNTIRDVVNVVFR